MSNSGSNSVVGVSQQSPRSNSQSIPPQSSSQNSRLICKVCGASFVYPGSYAKHMQKHEMAVSGKDEASPGGFQKKTPTPQRLIAPATVAPTHSYYPPTSTMSPEMNVLYSLKEVDASNSMRCPICSRQFKYKSCLITHMETKHPPLQQTSPSPIQPSPMSKVSALQCEFCGEVFVYHANLMKHKYKVHRELMQSYVSTSPIQQTHERPAEMSGQPGEGKGEMYRVSAFSSYMSPTATASQGFSLRDSSPSHSQPMDVHSKVEKDAEESQDVNAEGSKVRFPRPMYECPLCKMAFVYGSSFMKHMTQYHPGEACPYMGPITQEKFFSQPKQQQQQQQQQKEHAPNQHGHPPAKQGESAEESPDLMSIFEKATLRIAGIKQEGLKNLSSGFSLGLDYEKDAETGSHNGEIEEERRDKSGDNDANSDQSDGSQGNSSSQPSASVGNDAGSHQHASVIVDASDVAKYQSPPVPSGDASGSRQQLTMIPKLPELQLYKQEMQMTQRSMSGHQQQQQKSSSAGSNWRIVSRKCYVCPVCRMEFVYGASFIKHMRRYHPDAPFDLPKTTRTRPPSLATAGAEGNSTAVVADEAVAEKNVARVATVPNVAPMTSVGNVPILPAPIKLEGAGEGRSSPKQNPSDCYQAKRTRQCPCCSAVFVYVGSLIKHMTKCHPGSNWMTDGGDVKNFKKDENDITAATAAAVAAPSPEPRKDAVSRRGQRVHYCRVCSKPFFYIASLHKHLLDHGVTAEEVVGLTSLTNPKEEAPSFIPVFSGASSTSPQDENPKRASMRIHPSGGEPSMKRARFDLKHGIAHPSIAAAAAAQDDLSMDDEPSHTMSLRSRATRLPVSYAEAEVEEFEFVSSDDEENGIIIDRDMSTEEMTGMSQLTLPIVSFQQAQHAILSCMQQTYYALVALESLQQLVRFDQSRLPMAEVAKILGADGDGIASLANANTAVASMLQGGNELSESLAELQLALHEQAEEFNIRTVNSVHSEVIHVAGKNFLVEAPARKKKKAIRKEEVAVADEDRRHGVPLMDDQDSLETDKLSPSDGGQLSPQSKSPQDSEMVVENYDHEDNPQGEVNATEADEMAEVGHETSPRYGEEVDSLPVRSEDVNSLSAEMRKDGATAEPADLFVAGSPASSSLG
eukprot:m.16838 g.16838  ORF g.16838 m.16838 type:complete len:1139 (+) comp27160_c0_seq1:166-3582(+)